MHRTTRLGLLKPGDTFRDIPGPMMRVSTPRPVPTGRIPVVILVTGELLLLHPWRRVEKVEYGVWPEPAGPNLDPADDFTAALLGDDEGAGR
jgi:hypothetical protein